MNKAALKNKKCIKYMKVYGKNCVKAWVIEISQWSICALQPLAQRWLASTKLWRRLAAAPKCIGCASSEVTSALLLTNSLLLWLLGIGRCYEETLEVLENMHEWANTVSTHVSFCRPGKLQYDCTAHLACKFRVCTAFCNLAPWRTSLQDCLAAPSERLIIHCN